jgi:hypothetical protein
LIAEGQTLLQGFGNSAEKTGNSLNAANVPGMQELSEK